MTNSIHTTIEPPPIDESDALINDQRNNGFHKHRVSIIDHLEDHSNGFIANNVRRESFLPVNNMLKRK